MKWTESHSWMRMRLMMTLHLHTPVLTVSGTQTLIPGCVI